MGIAVSRDGYVYVADTWQDRIQKFTSTGTPVAMWGSTGSGTGQLDYPQGIAVDAAGNVYVADTANNRVQKFNANGGPITRWGGTGATGSGPMAFDSPTGIAISNDGYVYVTDTDNSRIVKFTSTGVYVTAWGTSGLGELAAPNGIAVDGAGNVYVVDFAHYRAVKFSSTGTYLGKWAGNGPRFGGAGSGPGQLDYPYGIALDGAGNVYVTDSGRIEVFGAPEVFITQFGIYGSGLGQFRYPKGIAIDSAGTIYVADCDNNRVQRLIPPNPTTPPTTIPTTPPTTTPTPTPTPDLRPVPAFAANPSAGVAPLTVQFSDTSTGSPTSWLWSFGDGTAAATQNPAHTYTTGGTFTVTLTAANSYGANTVIRTNSVTVASPDITGPTVITVPGSYRLTADILGCSADPCIHIPASDVVLDGMGHRISGTQKGLLSGIVVGARNVTVKNITVSDYYYGVAFVGAQAGCIETTTIDRAVVGLYLSSSQVTADRNRILNADYGICFSGSTGTTVTRNTVSGSSYPIRMEARSTGNTVADNSFNCAHGPDLSADSTPNTWSRAKTAGANIVGGSYLGGNYWAQTDGQGFSQTQVDSNSDGVCDYPYTITTGNADQYPLFIPPASTDITGPTAILSPGTYRLTVDILGASRDPCIHIRSSDVIFDGMGHRVGGKQLGLYTGIVVENRNVTVRNVTVTDWGFGVAFVGGSDGRLENTIIDRSTVGLLLLQASSNVTITRNRISGLTPIRVSDRSTDNTITNNAFNGSSAPDLSADSTPNTWSRAKTAGANIVGGLYLGGNYWTQADGQGFSQTHADSNSDGVCDTPYTITTGNVDQYPLFVLPTPAVKQVTGGAGLPTDTNGDGKYEDVNGNSRKDFADVVLYFNQMSWIAANEPLSAFDYNGNGRIDFADVVWLFDHL